MRPGYFNSSGGTSAVGPAKGRVNTTVAGAADSAACRVAPVVPVAGAVVFTAAVAGIGVHRTLVQAAAGAGAQVDPAIAV